MVRAVGFLITLIGLIITLKANKNPNYPPSGLTGLTVKKIRARLLGYPECCPGDDMPGDE